MKILYISPENTVGTLTLWKKIHEDKGHICRTLTFFPSPKGYEDDICLNLPLDFTKQRMAKMRHYFYKLYRGELGYYQEKEGFPPVWKPEGKTDQLFFRIKDSLWKPIVTKAIKDHSLYDFDVYHFESGMDFFKDSSFAVELHQREKKIICHYHGEDLRARGIMPELDAVSSLNLTNEVDLLSKHPDIKYLFLPFDTDQFDRRSELNKKLRLCHSPTNRYYKGSSIIISICRKLENEGLIDFDLVENLSHSVAIDRKKQADIFIDQLGDRGGWGYGMNSVESLSIGICTLTSINEKYNEFIPNHPFIHINEASLEKTLTELILDRARIIEYGKKGKEWVTKNHHYKNVVQQLYKYYREIGLQI